MGQVGWLSCEREKKMARVLSELGAHGVRAPRTAQRSWAMAWRFEGVGLPSVDCAGDTRPLGLGKASRCPLPP